MTRPSHCKIAHCMKHHHAHADPALARSKAKHLVEQTRETCGIYGLDQLCSARSCWGLALSYGFALVLALFCLRLWPIVCDFGQSVVTMASCLRLWPTVCDCGQLFVVASVCMQTWHRLVFTSCVPQSQPCYVPPASEALVNDLFKLLPFAVGLWPRVMAPGCHFRRLPSRSLNSVDFSFP